jgi:hypothetical protein
VRVAFRRVHWRFKLTIQGGVKMNYIKRLQHEVAEMTHQKDLAENALIDLANHLNCKKFRCGDSLDGYINISDVNSWVDRIRAELHEPMCC